MLTQMNLVRPRLLTVAMLLVSSLWLAPARGEDAPAEAAEAADSFVIGTGLVIGLPGTGDTEVDERLVEKSIVGVLKHAGLEPWRGEIVPGRVAKVIVTAERSPGAKHGAPLTITLTAVGDATSLAGGTLLATPLRDPNGTLHAIGQGPVVMESRVATAEGRQENSSTGERAVAMVQGSIVIGGHVQETVVD
jgi:flagellar P-ring protein precursor FlgI